MTPIYKILITENFLGQLMLTKWIRAFFKLWEMTVHPIRSLKRHESLGELMLT